MTNPPARTHRREFARRLLTGGEPRPARAVQRRARRRAHAHMHPVLRIVRIVAGWVLVIVGLIGVVLPLVPAVLLVPIGIVLVGRDAFLIRWSRVQMKLWLRDAEIRPGLIGRFGRWAARNERRFSKVLRERRLRDLRPQPSGS